VIWDISPLVDEHTAVWPGDTPFEPTQNLSLEAGDPVNLSDVRLSCHTGAHADAPSHTAIGGAGIDQLPLEPYLGPCTLLDVRPDDGAIRPTDLPAGGLRQRVLFRTRDRQDRRVFPSEFTALTVELVDWLAQRGVLLVGLDSPSVDLFDSKTLPVHNVLWRHHILNLECLALADVPSGDYELIALPLRLGGRDASPVRAVLRDLPSDEP